MMLPVKGPDVTFKERLEHLLAVFATAPVKRLTYGELAELMGKTYSENNIKSWKKRKRFPEGARERLVALAAEQGVDGVTMPWLKRGMGPSPRKRGAVPPRTAATPRSVAESPPFPYPGEPRSVGDSGDLPRLRREPDGASAATARSSMQGAETATRTPPSVQDIADRAAELVGQLAQRLYDRDPRLLREWLIRLAVDTPPELVPEVDALVSLARQARWRWKVDNAGEAGNTGGAKDDSTE
jgi:hypothetical protein